MRRVTHRALVPRLPGRCPYITSAIRWPDPFDGLNVEFP